MYRLMNAGIEVFAAALALLPVFLYLNRWLFPNVRRTAACGCFSLYLSGVYALAGLPNLLYIRFRPNLNFQPFAYMFSDLDATLLNVLLFIPLGMALPLLWKSYGQWWKTLLFGFLFSTAVETLQLFTYRATDVNDLMTNTLGTLLGFLIARAVLHFFPNLPSGNRKELPIVAILTFCVLFFLQPFASMALQSLLLY